MAPMPLPVPMPQWVDYVPQTAYSLAQRYVGLEEVQGQLDHPVIMAMLKLTGQDSWNGWPEHDEVPWCSAFANWVAWHLRYPRSKSLKARSWLGVGTPIRITEAQPRNDVVIFQRGSGTQPGPEDLDAPGHVAFFSQLDGEWVWVLGGNQGNSVSLARYAAGRVLGVRRLFDGQWNGMA